MSAVDGVVAFTGTLHGMTTRQRGEVERLLVELEPRLVLHGDAVGADAEFHALAVGLGIPVRIHPGDIDHKRAYCEGALEVLAPKPPIVRNHDMVNAAERLIGCPQGAESSYPRSGTWATIRYAFNVGCEVFKILP